MALCYTLDYSGIKNYKYVNEIDLQTEYGVCVCVSVDSVSYSANVALWLNLIVCIVPYSQHNFLHSISFLFTSCVWFYSCWLEMSDFERTMHSVQTMELK